MKGKGGDGKHKVEMSKTPLVKEILQNAQVCNVLYTNLLLN